MKKSLVELEKETKQLKDEAKMETTLLIISRIRQLTKSEETNISTNINSEYNVFLKIKGFQELDLKLQEIIKVNQELTTENGILKIQLNNLEVKYKELFSQKKDTLKELKKKNSKLLMKEKKNGKNLIDMYMYVFLKKRKNRGNREKAQHHLTKCTECKKKDTTTKFFSFEITPLLIEILKEKGYEDYILFDEKKIVAK